MPRLTPPRIWAGALPASTKHCWTLLSAFVAGMELLFWNLAGVATVGLGNTPSPTAGRVGVLLDCAIPALNWCKLDEGWHGVQKRAWQGVATGVASRGWFCILVGLQNWPVGNPKETRRFSFDVFWVLATGGFNLAGKWKKYAGLETKIKMKQSLCSLSYTYLFRSEASTLMHFQSLPLGSGVVWPCLEQVPWSFGW